VRAVRRTLEYHREAGRTAHRGEPRATVRTAPCCRLCDGATVWTMQRSGILCHDVAVE
jgi:hypothetical protein